MTSPALPDDDFDPEERELCPDGSCTGLLGDDGRCRVCGRSAGGAPPAATPPADADAAPPPEVTAAADPATSAGHDDDPFAGRALCPDGSCVGVLGPDGRCAECGRLDA